MKKYLGPKSCSNREEFESAIELINNVFRISNGFKPTMHIEFPYLLSENNKENIIIMKSGNEVISIASYLKRDIIIEDSNIKVASIGAVCTDEKYRKNGLSSQVLDKVEEKMRNDGVELALVSGTRTLYSRRNFVKIKSMKRYEFKGKEINFNRYEISDYIDSDILYIAKIYNSYNCRFRRSISEFKTIINSRPFNWGKLEYKTKVIRKEGRIVAYIILQIIDKKLGVVVEAFGKIDAIDISISKLTKELNLDKTIYDINIDDKLNELEREYELGIYNRGSFKIINYEKLMNSLRNYFRQYYEYADDIEFIEIEQNIEKSKAIYRIKIYDETLDIVGIGNITELIFGKHYDLDISENTRIYSFIKKSLPIPLPYMENLNYQ
ncbi:MAG: GNAT family N-acetyltransferase [Andreesenia angusta]|nr:GNAT family N-acetyltransferase [Andreesenia angusta]